MAIRGVGKKTAQKVRMQQDGSHFISNSNDLSMLCKIMEIITTRRLSRIQSERTEEVDVMKKFEGIYGVGKDEPECLF